MRRRPPLLLLLVGALALLPASASSGAPASLGETQSRLEAARQKLERKRQTARVLTSDIDRYDARIADVQPELEAFAARG